MIRYNLIDYGEYVYDKHREKDGYMADNDPRNIDILYTLFCNSKIEAVIADSGYSHEMRRLVCFLFLKQGT